MKKLAILVSYILLSGCGGGSSSEPTDTNQMPDDQPTVVGTTEYTDQSEFNNDAISLLVFGFDEIQTETILVGDEFEEFTIESRSIVVVDPNDISPGLAVGAENVNSAPNGISASLRYGGSSNILFDNLDDIFTFTLKDSTHGAGVWVGNLGASNNDPFTGTTVSFFDISGNEIVSKTLTQATPGLIGSGANNRIFYGVRSETKVSSVRVENSASDGDGILIDDFQIEVSM